MIRTTACTTCRRYWCCNCLWSGYRPTGFDRPCPWCWKGPFIDRDVHHRTWITCPSARTYTDRKD